MNQDVICEHLARVGIRAEIADNGKIGVDMVRERKEKGEPPFDLIFMDMFMPVMDGIEAASKIADLNTGTPIIAMTANVMVSEVEKYKKHGMPDCLGKPFTSQELWSILLKHLTPINIGDVDEQSGNGGMQEKLRINFIRNNRNIYAEIANAVSLEDTKLAHRLAHTLKSNAGMIGKTNLKNAAAEIEAMLQYGIASIWEAKMNELQVEFMQVIDELYPLLDEQQPAVQEERASLSNEQITVLFEKLEPLLQSANTDSMSLLDDVYAIPGGAELARLIENFDFESAAKELTDLRSSQQL
jgi:CheY-like chemotaxis protein